jgi:hypothetical protein
MRIGIALEGDFILERVVPLKPFKKVAITHVMPSLVGPLSMFSHHEAAH